MMITTCCMHCKYGKHVWRKSDTRPNQMKAYYGETKDNVKEGGNEWQFAVSFLTKKYIYYPRCTCKQAINYILLFIWHYKLQTVPEMLVIWWWWQMHKSFGHWMELYFGWIQNDKKKELPHAHSHHNASSYKYVLNDSGGDSYIIINSQFPNETHHHHQSV